MTTFKEGRHTGEFLLSEAKGWRSRENGSVASGEGVLEAGTLMARNGGSPTIWTAIASGGEANADGILWTTVDATDQAVEAAFIVRDAEVIKGSLAVVGSPLIDLVAAATALAVVGIIVR